MCVCVHQGRNARCTRGGWGARCVQEPATEVTCFPARRDVKIRGFGVTFSRVDCHVLPGTLWCDTFPCCMREVRGFVMPELHALALRRGGTGPFQTYPNVPPNSARSRRPTQPRRRARRRGAQNLPGMHPPWGPTFGRALPRACKARANDEHHAHPRLAYGAPSHGCVRRRRRGVGATATGLLSAQSPFHAASPTRFTHLSTSARNEPL